MAWISVHQDVIGTKLRKLAKAIKCSENEALGILVRFWLWGVDNANADGIIESGTKEDVADAIYAGLDKRYDPDEVVEILIAERWIDFDSGDLYIHDWKQWQKQWYKALESRKSALERYYKNKTQKEERALEEKAEKKRENKQEQRPSNETKSYTPSFEQFWSVYPRKKEKGRAYTCYNARLKDGWSPDELLEAARNYAAEVARRRTEEQYIKLASTFLSSTTPFGDFIKNTSQTILPEQTEDYNPYEDWRT